jgi:hypothetical protein
MVEFKERCLLICGSFCGSTPAASMELSLGQNSSAYRKAADSIGLVVVAILCTVKHRFENFCPSSTFALIYLSTTET